MAVFPAGAVLIAARSQIWSIGAAVSANGPVRSTEYGLGRLVDGSADLACRMAWDTCTFTLDLGTARTPNLVGLLNHNIDTGRVIGLTNEQGLARGFGGRDPNCWIDLRGFTGTTARYWTFAVNDNSVPVSIGEIVLATATVFAHGLWEGEFSEEVEYPGYRELTEQLKEYIAASGAAKRTASVTARMSEADRVALAAIFTETHAAPGRRVLVVPSTRINDLWYCDWQLSDETAYPNTAERTVALTLTDQVGGVLNGR